MGDYAGKSVGGGENLSMLEYIEMMEQISDILTEEQRKIFRDKLDGYTLKEIAESIGVNPKRVYRQFGKIKDVVAVVMEI